MSSGLRCLPWSTSSGAEVMSSEPQQPAPPHKAPPVELPAPTVWPLVLSVGVALLASGLALGLALSAVGGVLLLVGLVGWLGQLFPGKGHEHAPVEPRRPAPVTPAPGTVEQ